MKRKSKFDIPSILISIFLFSIYKILNMTHLYEKITYPIQIITINLIYSLQKLFGTEVIIQNFNLIYSNGLNIIITPICSGLEQLIFFYFMLSFFVGIDFKTKLKGFLTFAPIILIANFLRLFMIYPLSKIYGITTAWKVHDFMFIYGQGIFLLILISVWYFRFSRLK